MAGLQMTWHPNHLLHKRKSGPPLGLKNLGNTCYLNSVLQCLTYTPPLANFCLNNQHSSLCDSFNSDRKRECPFCILERRIVRSLSIDIPLDTPLKIQNSLRIFAQHFRGGRQEDAHEFLRYVIDACHNTCLKLLKHQQQPNPDTVVKEIFGGALQSQVKCLSCAYESNKTDEIMDISLDVFQSNSLKDALRRFFQPEVLDGNNKYSCEKCKKLSPARKQMSILQAPNVLVIQLKRFEGIHGGKIDRAIAFEEVLLLSSYMSKGSQDTQPAYNLFGSIVHSGYSPESGHYYAYIKDATGRWYCCNDSHVSLATLEEVLSEKVYILFFSRTNQRPRPAKNGYVYGMKSPDCNGHDVSISRKATVPLKPPLVPRPYGSDHCEKDISTMSKNGKACSNTRIKFGNFKTLESKKVQANGNGNVKVQNGVSAEIRSEIEETTASERITVSSIPNSTKESEVTEKRERSSISDSNGADRKKPSNVLNCGSKQTLLLPDGNGEVESNGLNSIKTEVCEDNVTEKVVAVGSSSEKIDSAMAAFAKKSCNLSGQDAWCNTLSTYYGEDSLAKLEKFKEVLADEATSVLQSCGWVDKVHNSMRAGKRKRAQEGNASSETNLKKLLISDAEKIFISQVPESLKKQLIDGLKSFSRGEHI